MCGNLICTNRKLIEHDKSAMIAYRESFLEKVIPELNLKKWVGMRKEIKGRKGFGVKVWENTVYLAIFFWNEKGNKQSWHIGECGV